MPWVIGLGGSLVVHTFLLTISGGYYQFLLLELVDLVPWVMLRTIDVIHILFGHCCKSTGSVSGGGYEGEACIIAIVLVGVESSSCSVTGRQGVHYTHEHG
ncbi:hypothetical protein BC938DRAFT_479265 [Jimgerdemannia flammicorona]|uniref:Uncharacterized protein n=1 Tax=Jimgerdemannia flammicorona TaxID=994334 RepID=A0A433QLA1_9FUNG|nr:hypothetical protein BC938DRAFT_479265 [Jimgerdemannia flammicorona]